MRTHVTLGYWLVLLLYPATACDARTPRETKSAPRVTASCGELEVYPPARWRLAPESINRVAFQLERIVIAHNGVRANTNAHRSAPAEPARTFEEAIELAARITCEARRDSERFAAMATRYSADSATRPHGGAMGVVRATMLEEPLVDALDVLEEGEVSAPIPTSIGLQVIRHHRVEAQVQVSAKEIVVMYWDTDAWPRPGRRIARSRQEAHELASRIAREARSDPGRFGQLIREHSDAYSALADGDFGERGTHEGDGHSLALHVIASLEIGQVSDVVEGIDAYRVFKRVPNRDRVRFAMSEILIAHQDSLLERTRDELPPRSREQAQEIARSLIRRALGAGPKRFEELRREYCGELGVCDARQQTFASGRSIPIIEGPLRSVRPGQVVPMPVETPMGFLVLRRETPNPVPPESPALTFQVPRPAYRTLSDWLDGAPGPMLARLLVRESEDFPSYAFLSEGQAGAFAAWIQHHSEQLAAAPNASRRQLAISGEGELAALIGPEGARRYHAFIDQQLVALQRSFLRGMGVPVHD